MPCCGPISKWDFSVRILVTGGAGVIGSELVPILLQKGHDVVVGDLKPRPRALDDSVVYLQMDLNELTRDSLRELRVEIVIHLAATFERSLESAGFWEENYRHNVQLSHHIATLAREVQEIRRLVFASSYLIYDSSQYLFADATSKPIVLTEDSAIRPRNLVGMAKLSHESELSFLRQFEETPFTSVSARIFRGYGRGSRDVISRWVRSLLRSDKITVYRPEGLFDYIYAADSARALAELALDFSVEGPVNVGSGEARTVSDVVGVLSGAFTSARIELVHSDIPIEASQSDIRLINTLVGWEPQYSLERGIREIIEFEQGRLQVEK